MGFNGGWLGFHRLHYKSLLSIHSQSHLKIESEVVETTLADENLSRNDAETRESPKESTWDWQSNVKLALLISIFTLIANFVLLVVGITDVQKRLRESLLRTMFYINILSTGLLTSSNYCMQLVCAPTRVDMNRLHARGDYFDIGILSFRNVRHIPRRRALLWFILAASSVPLHLLYNSSIFSVTVGRDYEIDFLMASNISTMEMQKIPASHERLENSIWMEKYGTKYITEYGNLYLVLDRVSFELGFSLKNLTWELQKPRAGTDFSWEAINPSDPSHTQGFSTIQSALVASTKRREYPISEYSAEKMPSIEWPSPLYFRVSENSSWKDILTLNPDAWMDPPWHVSYGLAEIIHEGSAVQISSAFIAVVLACNALKGLAIYYTLRGSYSSQIITQGDAISTYLENPDPYTVGLCATDKQSMLEKFRVRSNKELEVEPWEYRKVRYTDRALGRWNSYLTLGSVIAASIVGVVYLSIQRPSEWGTASKKQIQFFVSPLDTRGIVLTSWIANSPQVLLSVFYLAANRICTSLCFAREWNDHALRRKALRVTHPQGKEQRSSYFLQLPYRWAIPLTAMSGLLHWLLSQSLFLVRIETYDNEKHLKVDASRCACGYSTLSLLVFLVCFIAMAASILALMSRSIIYSIPPADHCSLVISAACHPPPVATDSHLKPVRWGVVPNLFGGNVDHCSFSSEEVKTPQEGSFYA